MELITAKDWEQRAAAVGYAYIFGDPFKFWPYFLQITPLKATTN